MYDLSENLDAHDLWELWERSVPLEQAFYRLGPRAESERYVRLKSASPASGLPEFVKAVQEAQSMGGNIQTALTNFARKTPGQEEAERLERRLKDICTQRLQQAVLFGIGFSSPRKADDAPCFVPLDTWGQFISWHNGKVSSGSLKMEAVHIGRTNWVEEYNHPDQNSGSFNSDQTAAGCEIENSGSFGALTRSAPEMPPEIPEPRRPGRPSKRDLMWESYIKCLRAGLIDPARPKTEAHRIVLAWIQENHPHLYEGGKDMGYDVFRDLIAKKAREFSEFPKSDKL